MPWNALNLVNCHFNIAQRIIIEDIRSIITRALSKFSDSKMLVSFERAIFEEYGLKKK